MKSVHQKLLVVSILVLGGCATTTPRNTGSVDGPPNPASAEPEVQSIEVDPARIKIVSEDLPDGRRREREVFEDENGEFVDHGVTTYWDKNGARSAEVRFHNGKLHGFHDPSDGSTTVPFSPVFMNDLATRRGARLTAFEAYRKGRDPTGMFCNDHLRSVSLCVGTESADE